MTLREQFEQREIRCLASGAAKAGASRGRIRPEPEHDNRTAFQRDRDRILHSKAFRRLKHKTQVFLAPEGDHYRTRLTHTLEASQIARTVSRALFLNEDLTEAIALGHDLGHTPFGHAGEAVLNEMYAEGFRHAEQSLRVVDVLEETSHGPGLNLTYEVRDGILHHSKGRDVLNGGTAQRACTLEGVVVSVCDAIAYINHDIDDAVRAGLVALEDLPTPAVAVLGKTTSARINTMVTGLIEGSTETSIGITPEIWQAMNELRTFMYKNVYPCPAIDTEVAKAKKLLRELYLHFMQQAAGAPSEEDAARRTVDLIAGMTDQYALRLYEQLFFPAAWRP